MTPEDRAARKALLSLARWHRREAKDWQFLADASTDEELRSARTAASVEHLVSAREAERRARRIGG